jgi:hypothetical protein
MPLTQVECWEEDERPDPGSVGGITGGGVDGAVTMAGGENLMAARLKLPILPGELPPPPPLRHRDCSHPQAHEPIASPVEIAEPRGRISSGVSRSPQ